MNSSVGTGMPRSLGLPLLGCLTPEGEKRWMLWTGPGPEGRRAEVELRLRASCIYSLCPTVPNMACFTKLLKAQLQNLEI